MTMLPSEVLDKAAETIVRDGWTRGSYYRAPTPPEMFDDEARDAFRAADDEANRSEPCCQAGAINRAACGYAWTPPGIVVKAADVKDRADNWMNAYVMRTFATISSICWNDEPGRTADEVVAALRGAANLAREAGE